MQPAVLLLLALPPFVQPLLPLRRVPALGECLAGVPATSVHTMAESAQTWPAYTVMENGIEYTIGIDREDRVQFVATHDAAFIAPEGLRVGDAPAAALWAAPGRSIVLERGWGYFVELPSGWFAFIDDSSPPELNLGTRNLGAAAKITMFFRR